MRMCLASETTRYSVNVQEKNGSNGSHRRYVSKQSLYLPPHVLDEMNLEAARLGRSLSWIARRAWRLARLQIRKMPGSAE